MFARPASGEAKAEPPAASVSIKTSRNFIVDGTVGVEGVELSQNANRSTREPVFECMTDPQGSKYSTSSCASIDHFGFSQAQVRHVAFRAARRLAICRESRPMSRIPGLRTCSGCRDQHMTQVHVHGASVAADARTLRTATSADSRCACGVRFSFAQQGGHPASNISAAAWAHRKPPAGAGQQVE